MQSPDAKNSVEAARNAQLLKLVSAFSRALAPTEIANAILFQGAQILGASAGMVAMIEEETSSLKILGARDLPIACCREINDFGLRASLPAAQCISEGRAIWIHDAALISNAHFAKHIQQETAIRGMAAIPLTLNERIIGAIAFCFASPQEFQESDRTFILTLAEQCAQSLDRARLYEAEMKARAEAEASQRRLQLLAKTSNLLSEPLELQTMLNAIVDSVIPDFADACIIHIFDDIEKKLRTAFRHADPIQEFLLRELIQLARLADIQEAKTFFTRNDSRLCTDFDGELKTLTGISENPSFWSRFSELQFQTAAIIQLEGRNGKFGTISFFTSDPKRTYTQKDFLLAQEIGHRIAFAAENARLYEQACLAVRVRDDFISIASHELKTPLTPLKLQMQMLDRALKTGRGVDQIPIPMPKLIQDWTRQVDRLTGLVDNLLDVTRISSGQLTLKKEPVELVELTRELLDRFGTEASRISIESEKPVFGVWDRLRIEQVVLNLLTNAMKYGEGSPITIKVEEDDGRAILTVRDQGPGIPARDLSRIFHRFERGSQTKAGSGLGLGLFISREIIEAHRGSLTAESEPGRGAAFRTTLPSGVEAR